MKKRIRGAPFALVVLCAAVAPAGASAQEMTVRGQVLYNPRLPDCQRVDPCTEDVALTSPEDWQPPRSAVNVVVQGTDRVVKTRRNGTYEVTVPSPSASLMFLAIGHNRIEVPVEGRATVDVRLTPTPLPVIERLLGLIMPQIVAGELPDIDRLATDARVNRETARDILWLVIGDRRMAERYPGEYVPDYRFDDSLGSPAATGGAP